MITKVAINGYGRIGRMILRAWIECGKKSGVEIVAINDLGDSKINAHLTRYDTVHGRFSGQVTVTENAMFVNGHKIDVFSEKDPKKLPWGALGVDVVHECTGLFAQRDLAAKHIDAGAKKVIISAPAGKDVDATVVYGVNHQILKSNHQVISNASCTTNCLAQLVKPLHEKIGIVSGLMTTIHSYTNDQVLIDTYHKDLHRARSATHSMIPTKTGAASAIGLVIPELEGKLDGLAIRVPTINVSLVDLTFQSKRSVSVNEVNQILQQATREFPEVFNYSEEPLVSVDYNHSSASATVDATQTKVIGNTVKVLAWYDNEWGFANRMLDVTEVFCNVM